MAASTERAFWPLRYQLAVDGGLCRDVLDVFMRVVFGWLSVTAAR